MNQQLIDIANAMASLCIGTDESTEQPDTQRLVYTILNSNNNEELISNALGELASAIHVHQQLNSAMPLQDNGQLKNVVKYAL